MTARNKDHARAAAKVAILSRWREANDPELVQARRDLAHTRAKARLGEATAVLIAVSAELRGSGVAS